MLGAPDTASLPQIQKQIGSKNLLGIDPGGVGNQLPERSGAGGLPVYRQHINLRVQGAAVVHAAVHVNGHMRNQQKIPVDVHKAGEHAVSLLHGHTPGNGKRAVHPGGKNCAAVFFHIQPHIVLVSQFGNVLQLERGGIAVRRADHKTGGAALRQPECDQCRAIAGHIIALSRVKIPNAAFLQRGKAGIFKQSAKLFYRVEAAGGTLDKRHHFLRSFGKHQMHSFPDS